MKARATLSAVGSLTLGCDVAQGFLASRPLPAADLMGWMAESAGGAHIPAYLRPSTVKRRLAKR